MKTPPRLEQSLAGGVPLPGQHALHEVGKIRRRRVSVTVGPYLTQTASRSTQWCAVSTASAASKESSSKSRDSTLRCTTGAVPFGRCAIISADGSTAVTSRRLAHRSPLRRRRRRCCAPLQAPPRFSARWICVRVRAHAVRTSELPTPVLCAAGCTKTIEICRRVGSSPPAPSSRRPGSASAMPTISGLSATNAAHISTAFLTRHRR